MRCPNMWRKKDTEELIPCGKCPICKSRKREEWAFRIEQEMKDSFNAWFITLTYNDIHIPILNRVTGEIVKPELMLDRYVDHYVPILVKNDLQLFNKALKQREVRLRSKYPELEKVAQESSKYHSVRFVAVGEYGTKTKRPHYHGIYFNLSRESAEKVHETWKKGNVQVVPANTATIKYILKYMIKDSEEPDPIDTFKLQSTKPAIGAGYIDRTKDWNKRTMSNYVVDKGGIKKPYPRYYKEKQFDKEEREVLNEKSKNEMHGKTFKEFEKLKKEKGFWGAIDYQKEQAKAKCETIIKRSKKEKL